MKTATAEITLYAPWVHSLKEKRMIIRSLVDKIKKFNVSIAEVDEQDIHQKIVLGVACVSGDERQASRVINEVVSFIEGNCEADIVNINIEVL